MSLYIGNEKYNNVTVLFKDPDGIDNIEVATPSISINDLGLITATINQHEGYVNAEIKSSTKQLPVQEAATITPSSFAQIAIESGKYAIGQVIVDPVQAETKNIVSNGTYVPSNGTYFSSVTVDVPSDSISLQEKTVSPSESVLMVTPDDGYGGLSSVKVNQIPTTYVGSEVPRKSSTNIQPSDNMQIAILSGTYATGDIVVNAVQAETKLITSNGIYNPPDGKYFSSITVDIKNQEAIFNAQEKSIIPNETIQIVSPDAGYDGLSSVTVGAISTTYVGSGISRNGTLDGVISTQGGEFIIPSGLTDGGKVVANIESTPITNDIINGATNVNGTSNSIDDFTVTVNVPAGYHEAQTLTKTFSDILPGLDIDASADKILNTYQAYDEAGKVITGSMTDNGAFNRTLDKNTTSVTIPAGYHNGSGVITRSINTQEKMITPTEAVQYATPDTDYDGLIKVTIGAISSTYIGSAVPTQAAKSIAPSTSVQTVVPSGTYVTGDIKVSAMPTGALNAPTINTSTGLITAKVGTSGYISSNTSKTLQLNTKSSATITPTENTQTIPAGIYLTGAQTIAAIPNDYIGSAVVVQNYYTGSSIPSSSLGKDGDLYFKI